MANKEVFISYGHNTYDFLVERLVSDLNKEGLFNIFLDKDVLHLGDWEVQITHGIERCDYFVFLVSEKSTSLDGYCMNELSFAAELKKTIIPVCLDDSYLPLSITRLQRLFLQKSFNVEQKIIDDVYQPVFDRLLRILKGEEELGLYLESFDIATTIQQFDSFEIGHHTRNFIGRESFFKDFENWLYNNSDYVPFYLLQAAPGVGKTAISAMLTLKYPEHVAAIHFCSFNNKDKTDAKNIIKNLASQLAYRNQDYANQVRNIIKRGIDNDLDAKRLFEVFINEAGSHVSFEKKQVFVIDALDEAVINNKNDFAELLVTFQKTIPSWLKFVCTSRPQKNIVSSYFDSSHQFLINEDSSENTEDLKQYYLKEFPELEGRPLEILMKKTHGSFLYASKIIANIKGGELKLTEVKSFPDGIFEYYKIWFDRIFLNPHEPVDYEPSKKIISLLLVCSVSPTLSFLVQATEMDEDDVQKSIDKLSDFFVVNEEQLKARHKSVLDWLSNKTKCPEKYYISKQFGYKLLLHYIVEKKNKSRLWTRDKYVILDYQNALRGLNKVDELIELLMDGEYLDACLKSSLYTLYEGLSSYIANISYLYKQDEEYPYVVYESECFTYIFTKYRKQMYNSGLFIKLDECGFAKFLKDCDPSDDIEYDLGVGQYFYISQHYQEAHQSLKEFVKDHDLKALDVQTRSEVGRMAMLVYRKLVLFDQIEAISPYTIKDAQEAHELYEESLAYLTLSKIYARQLRKEDCYKAADEAVRLLQLKVDEQDDKKKVADHLFLAEDYRVYADGCIWLKDYEKAMENLLEVKKIYASYVDQHDRYYTRYLYTSLFYEIVTKGDKKRIFELYEDALESATETKDEYDRGQVHFLISLYYYLNNKEDDNYLSLALEHASKAIEIGEKLTIYLEALEAKCLYNLILLEMGQEKKYDEHYNKYSDFWIDYVESFIKELKD